MVAHDEKIVVYASAKSGLTQRAPDWWESARFQAVCVAWSWFRQSGVVSSRPPAGNASPLAGFAEKQNRQNIVCAILKV